VFKKLRYIALLAAGGALLVAPVTSQGHHRQGHTKGPSKSKSCNKTPRVGFVVRGTLTSFTPDTAGNEVNEASVTITVTGANRHARRSGELQDMNPNEEGVQVKGGTYTVSATDDPFRLRLVAYEAGESPATGDHVRISGLIPRVRSRCAAEGTSLADRYLEENVRRVRIKDADND
jgi:hypothetical protein